MLATASVLGGRYALGPLLGRGGVADVYRADDLDAGVPVAVKVLRTATTADLCRFEREARTLERLSHPGIVRLRDEGQHDGVPYLVLDLVEGEPLSTVIERGPLDETLVQRMGVALAGALAHAHDLGIVHRDVKPGNVLVDQDGSVRLSDFGIARLVDSSAVTALTDTGLVIGTAAYLAPEQVRGESAMPASDVYALGLVLLEAITGERAYGGPPTEAAMARLQHPPEIPALSPWLASLLTAMTAIEPSRRPRAAAVEDAFANRATTGEHTAVMPVSPVPTLRVRAPTVVRGRGRLLAAVAAVVLALALVLVLVEGRRSVGAGPGPSTTSTTSTTSTASTAPTTVPRTTAPAVTTPPRTAPPATPPRGDNKGKHGGDNKGNEGGD